VHKAEAALAAWQAKQVEAGRIISIQSIDNATDIVPYQNWTPFVKCVITVKYYGDAVE